MENVNELENFRERWRNELVCRDEQMARNEEDLDDAESVLRHADVDDGDDVTKKRKIGFAKRTSNYYMAEEGDLDDCLPYYPKTDPVVGEAVSIANDLLKGTYVKRKLSESDEHTNKDGKIDKETKKTRTLEAKGRTNANLLDTLIADLNEINEIPFFDIALPRELAMKIFEHFEMSDLLSCAQVSVSWRSLADDDILWCRICHRLGYLMNIHAGEKSSWKEAVRECITEDKSLRSNWKGRIGCMSTLEYVRGGILTSAQSYQDAIIAGYTNGRVRLWNINDIESDLFVTSHETIGLEQRCRPAVDHVATNSNIAMATYDNGDVDVWNLKDTSTPTYHFHCDENIQSVAMAADGTAIATAVGYTVRIRGC
uniref:F-box/WD repeat-containing protein 8-like n=1 Tax=Saccoglossus kowalevskii TaxID=10224 RepID=A0ABM0MSS1_SACKO|nr:PREDICTED: F-box/WD repeat-containing protein 8-like [Saccoglossus kowalevskii]